MSISRNPSNTRGGREVGVNVRHPLLALRNDLDSLFGNWFAAAPVSASSLDTFEFVPKLDVNENAEKIVVTAELPGIAEEDMEITIDDDVLTLRGHKKQEVEKDEKGHYYRERRYGSFERRLQLSEGVNEDAVDAAFSKGVLTITLPKLAEEKRRARKVSVRSQ